MQNRKAIILVCNRAYNIARDIEEVSGVTVVKVICSGRITLPLIIKAFEMWAEGVMGVGCKRGECHYVTGNEQAKQNFNNAGKLLHLLGIKGGKIKFDQISRNEPERLEEIIDTFIKGIGHNTNGQ